MSQNEISDEEVNKRIRCILTTVFFIAGGMTYAGFTAEPESDPSQDTTNVEEQATVQVETAARELPKLTK